MNNMTQAGLPTPGGPSTLLSVTAGLVVVLIALVSALYFVMTRQEQLRAANTLMDAPSAVEATPQPEPVQPKAAEKKQTPKRVKPTPKLAQE